MTGRRKLAAVGVAVTTLAATGVAVAQNRPRAVADIAVGQHPGMNPAAVGIPMDYEVSAVNNGPQVPASMTIRNTLPTGVGFVSVTASLGGRCTGPAVGQTGTVVCTWRRPAVGVQVLARIVIQPNGVGTLVNTARVRTSGRDPVSTNNVSSTTIQAIPYAVAQGGQRCTTVGTPGDDVIDGTTGDDVICGLGGNDVIRGLEGNDVIDGGSGADLIVGGPGNDRIYGGTGANRLFGGTGRDILVGGPGREILWGGLGVDVAKVSKGDRLISVERRV